MSRFLLAALFVIAGINHFRNPAPYLGIMPPALPFPRELVALSGAFEVAGGVGLLIPRTRKLAAWGIIALLLAVFPANIYAAFAGMKLGTWDVPKWLLWARLPLQLPMIWWAFSSAEVGRRNAEEASGSTPPIAAP